MKAPLLAILFLCVLCTLVQSQELAIELVKQAEAKGKRSGIREDYFVVNGWVNNALNHEKIQKFIFSNTAKRFASYNTYSIILLKKVAKNKVGNTHIGGADMICKYTWVKGGLISKCIYNSQ